MDPQAIESLTKRLLAGEIAPEQFQAELLALRSFRMDHATLDLDRQRRCGFSEVVYGEGKKPETIRDIFIALLEKGLDPFATRVSLEQAECVLHRLPHVEYNPVARTLLARAKGGSEDANVYPVHPHVAILTAGSSDLPVAEEARETLHWMHVPCQVIHDVGVAGPHRLMERVKDFQDASAIVVIAGLEGALPSVVGGYVKCPVIAVPTSVGYGVSFGGVAALLGMLNSCASNVVVVNIDGGFRAAYVAGMICKQSKPMESDA